MLLYWFVQFCRCKIVPVFILKIVYAYLKATFGQFCLCYTVRLKGRKCWRERKMTYDKATMLDLNPEHRDVTCICLHAYDYSCPVIVVRLVCLSYPLHKLSFSWKIISIDHPSHQDASVIALKRYQEASLKGEHQLTFYMCFHSFIHKRQQRHDVHLDTVK